MPNEEFAAGKIVKSASIDMQEITDKELHVINKFALYPLKAEDIFLFKIVICDNEVDRDFECFSIKALEQLKKLFVGKALIKDHAAKADNQIARIYSTELQQSSKVTQLGELYTQLIAKCYMIKTDENKSFIAEIKGGIKKEVSVCCATSRVVCSICGVDNQHEYCRHCRGKTYDKNGKKTICTFQLDEATDAYEVSFVAIPAQRNAGTCKALDKKNCLENQMADNETSNIIKNKDSELMLKIKIHESFILSQNKKTKMFKEEL